MDQPLATLTYMATLEVGTVTYPRGKQILGPFQSRPDLGLQK